MAAIFKHSFQQSDVNKWEVHPCKRLFPVIIKLQAVFLKVQILTLGFDILIFDQFSPGLLCFYNTEAFVWDRWSLHQLYAEKEGKNVSKIILLSVGETTGKKNTFASLLKLFGTITTHADLFVWIYLSTPVKLFCQGLNLGSVLSRFRLPL